MTIGTKREKPHDFINTADDRKLMPYTHWLKMKSMRNMIIGKMRSSYLK